MPLFAGVAHPVERHLAKVEVASSSLVTRSIKKKSPKGGFFFFMEKRERLEDLKCNTLISEMPRKVKKYLYRSLEL